MQTEFTFTITDVARLLGKSPVTLRGWERQKLIRFPREREGGDRKMTCMEVTVAAKKAHSMGRINLTRLQLIEGAMGSLSFIETVNRTRT
jgi:hypothetical protein